MPKVEPFEKYTSQYEGWFERNRFVYESEIRAIRKQLPESGKGIEIGAGSGRFAAPLGIKLGVGKSYQQHKKKSVFYRIATFYTVDEVVSNLIV